MNFAIAAGDLLASAHPALFPTLGLPAMAIGGGSMYLYNRFRQKKIKDKAMFGRPLTAKEKSFMNKQKRQRQSQIPEFMQSRRKRTKYPDYVPLEKPVGYENQSSSAGTIKSPNNRSSEIMLRKSTGNDVNNILVTASRRQGQRLSRGQYIQFSMMPAFHGRKIISEQIDIVSPNQSVNCRIMYDNAFLANLYECANKAVGNQSATQLNGETGSYQQLALGLRTQIASAYDANQNLKRTTWIVYNRKVIDRFVNSSTTTLTFTLYYMRVGNPLGKYTTLTDDKHPTSLAGLLSSMLGDAQGSDQFLRLGGTLSDGTTGLYKRSHLTYGQNPIQYPGVKRYYKCFKTRVFTLKPGEMCNVQHVLPGMKILNGGTWVDYYEYPGTTYTLLTRVQAQLVGSELNTDVTYGNGQYQHISEISASSKILPIVQNIKQDFGIPNTVTEANQEQMNVETGQKDTTHAKL